MRVLKRSRCSRSSGVSTYTLLSMLLSSNLRELPAVPLVGLHPVARFGRYERGGNNEHFDPIRYQLVGEPEAEGARLICHLHPAALVTLEQLLQRLVLAGDATVEDLFSVRPHRDLPALLVHVDPHVDILTRPPISCSSLPLSSLQPPFF